MTDNDYTDIKAPLGQSQSLITKREITWIEGEPGVGKSWLAAHVAVETTNWFERVLYVDYQHPVADLAHRLESFSPTNMELIEVLHSPEPDRLLELAPTRSYKAIIVDDAVSAMGTRYDSENDDDDIGRAIRWTAHCLRTLQQTGAAIIIIDSLNGVGSYVADLVLRLEQSESGVNLVRVVKDRDCGLGVANGDVVAEMRIDFNGRKHLGGRTRITFNTPTKISR